MSEQHYSGKGLPINWVVERLLVNSALLKDKGYLARGFLNERSAKGQKEKTTYVAKSLGFWIA